MMGDKKILILGAKGFPKARCYDWSNKELYKINIPDYEIVIVNVASLKNIEGKLGQSKIKLGLKKILDTKGILMAMGCPEREIHIYGEHAGKRIVLAKQSNYEWCPIKLKINNETGTTSDFKDSTFVEYFKNIKEWSYCFEIPEKHENDNLTIANYVTNRYGSYLAGKIFYYSRYWKSGDFYFLPCPTKISDIEAITFFLEKFLFIHQTTPPPEWTESIEISGLSKIKNIMKINLQKIKQLSDENDKLKKEESELISYRELLYETGTALEEIVKKVFTVLGYKPKPPIYKEEYIVEFDKKVGIVECKGNEKSIKRSDFRQLLDYLKEYEIDYKGEHKGILVGNAWRLEPLEERNKNETPIFPVDVIKIATKHDTALVSTIDLFKVFCRYLKGEIKDKVIIEKIFTAKGVVKFDV